MPSTSDHHFWSGVSTNEATTTHTVISAPTDTSNALTINALACPMAASASGIVAMNRPLRLNSDVNDASSPRV
jgi:hypothetical protein